MESRLVSSPKYMSRADEINQYRGCRCFVRNEVGGGRNGIEEREAVKLAPKGRL